jgi:hypothetical protein
MARRASWELLNVSRSRPTRAPSPDADRLSRAPGRWSRRARPARRGAMSTAPYLEALIPETQEADRLHWAGGPADRQARPCRSAPTRAGRCRPGPLGERRPHAQRRDRAAADPALASPGRRGGRRARCSWPPGGRPGPGEPLETVLASLTGSLARARAADADDRILVDPGIGFFRGGRIEWPEGTAGCWPACPSSGASGAPSTSASPGSPSSARWPARPIRPTVATWALAATAAAVLGGDHVIRAHAVAETAKAVRVAQAIRRAGTGRA